MTKKTLLIQEEIYSLVPTCCQCGNKGHIKLNFPQNQSQKHNQKLNQIKYIKPQKEAKKEYITWDDNDMEY